MLDKFWLVVKNALCFGGLTAAFCAKKGIIDRDLGIGIMVACGFVLLCVIFIHRPRYRPYTFRAIGPDEIPARTRKDWDRLTQDYALLGYHPVGDYEMRASPRKIVRYFLSDNPNTHGSICDDNGDSTPDFMTYFEDGRVIESVIHPTVPTRCKDNENLWGIVQRGGTVFDLHNTHQRAINAYQEATGTPTLDVTPNRLFEFSQYATRLMWWDWLGKTRDLGPPEPPQRVANKAKTAADEAMGQLL